MKILNHSALLGIAFLMMGFAFSGCDQPTEVTAGYTATSQVSNTGNECCGKCSAGETPKDCCGKCKQKESEGVAESKCCDSGEGTNASVAKKDCCGKCKSDSADSESKQCCGKCKENAGLELDKSTKHSAEKCSNDCNSCAEGNPEDCKCGKNEQEAASEK